MRDFMRVVGFSGRQIQIYYLNFQWSKESCQGQNKPKLHIFQFRIIEFSDSVTSNIMLSEFRRQHKGFAIATNFKQT